jgi:PhnB protein
VINIVQYHLRVKDADKQIDFLKKTFEAKKLNDLKLPDGSIVHAEIRIGDFAIMQSEALANSI